MSENPLEPLLKTLDSISRCVQTHLSRVFVAPQNASPKPTLLRPLLSFSPTPVAPDSTTSPIKEKKAAPLTKEELGRATWTLLHSIAAQMAIISRLYPCKECADHFKEVLKANPVQAGSQAEFSQWLCHVHNVVNRSLGKVIFPCQRVNARWGKLDCKDRSCDLEGTVDIKTLTSHT
ncbi:FAD-linked sulfhydryl oxidase ERV1 isoform X2 [Ananas comosus]|uniref:Sulfhydryl oxidase n=1 Tax=Ananas comosus TaxID=4615 RepID=A0A6P5G7Y5_ANACO|nr:FAD-linked sulfhydryl oxidase ERV1 isoform X2 [Ananas comosus]